MDLSRYPPLSPSPRPQPEAILGIITPNGPLLPFLFNIGKALLILLVALAIAGAAKRWTIRLLTRSKRINLNVASLVGNLVQVAIVALGIINVLIASASISSVW